MEPPDTVEYIVEVGVMVEVGRLVSNEFKVQRVARTPIKRKRGELR